MSTDPASLFPCFVRRNKKCSVVHLVDSITVPHIEQYSTMFFASGTFRVFEQFGHLKVIFSCGK